MSGSGRTGGEGLCSTFKKTTCRRKWMMPEIVTHADDLCAPPCPTPVCECVNTKKRNATTDKNNVCTGRLTFPSATDCPEAVVEYRRRYSRASGNA